MPPVTRKRKTPLPTLSLQTSSSSEDEYSVTNVASTSTHQHKLKCPVNGCKKTCKKSTDLRLHYRTHTKAKPFKCTFKSCKHAFSTLGSLIGHIRVIHGQQTKNEAKKYVEVQKNVLDEETKQLGFKEYLSSTIYNEKIHENAETVAMPQFTTIHRSSTGHFICPYSECNKQLAALTNLKNHYRIHCGSNFRPFRCTFSDSCRYAASTKHHVEIHINVKHIPKDNTDLDASSFVETRADLLEMEEALFSSAEIISAPKTQTLRPHKCTFSNCSKSFTTFTALRSHLRLHRDSKPYRCLFSNCKYTARVKAHLIRHIHMAHFNICEKDFFKLSREEKQRADQYVAVDQEELDIEETQIETSRIGPKKKPKKQNVHSTSRTVSGNESPDFTMVQFEDNTTDDDDKDELATLRATTQSTSTN